MRLFYTAQILRQRHPKTPTLTDLINSEYELVTVKLGRLVVGVCGSNVGSLREPVEGSGEDGHGMGDQLIDVTVRISRCSLEGIGSPPCTNSPLC